MTYEEALNEAREKGVRGARDEVKLAAWLKDCIQLCCGAVSPKLVFDGAQKRGLRFLEVARLARKHPEQIEELQWL